MSSLTALPGRQQQSLTSPQRFHQGCAQTSISPSIPRCQPGAAQSSRPGNKPGGLGLHHGTESSAPAAGLEVQVSPWAAGLRAVPRSDARGSRADRGTLLERDRGLRGFVGRLETALLCLKMNDCFVPGCLLRRFTDSSLKCNLKQ